MSEAEKIRREWLAKIGLSQEEIDESVADDPPNSIDTEMRQLDAIESVLARIQSVASRRC